MRVNAVKRALRNGQASFGTWLSTGDLYAARTLARMGFDWLTVDLEHGAIDWSQAATLFGAIANAGCVPLARVPEGSHRDIKRALDAGAFGIVAPMVDTPEQAAAIVSATKYPPVGNRSLGGGLHALAFNTSSAEYYSKANDEILVIIQTESPLGIANAEAIYRTPGVDGVFVGPVDLRARLGNPGTQDDLETALEQIIAVGRMTGTPTGMHTMNSADAIRRRDQGMQFIAIGSDLRFMATEAANVLEAVRPGVSVAVAY